MKLVTRRFVLVLAALVPVIAPAQVTSDGQWHHHAPWPTTSSIVDVAANGELFVAVTADGQALVSAEGAVWMPYPTPAAELLAVAADEHGFVATGADGEILSSPDGREWIVEHVGDHRFLDVAACDGVRVAVGSRGDVATSVDGGAWTTQLLTHYLSLQVAVCAGRRFIAVGPGNARYSDGGLEWSVGALPSPGESMRAAVWTGDRFEALSWSDGDTRLLSSPDGETWTVEPAPLLPHTPRDLAMTPEGLQVVGGDGIPDTIYSFGWWALRDHSGAWTVVEGTPLEPEPDQRTPRALCSRGGITVAVGSSGLIRTTRRFGEWQAGDSGRFWPTLAAAASATTPMVFIGGNSGVGWGGAWEMVWRSTDGLSTERTWFAVGRPPLAVASCQRDWLVLRDPTQPTRLLAGRDGAGWQELEAPTTSGEEITGLAGGDGSGFLLLAWNGEHAVVYEHPRGATEWTSTPVAVGAPLAAAVETAHGWAAVGQDGWAAVRGSDGTWVVEQLDGEGATADLDAIAADEDGLELIAGGRDGAFFAWDPSEGTWVPAAAPDGVIARTGGWWAVGASPDSDRVWIWEWGARVWHELPSPPSERNGRPIGGLIRGPTGLLLWRTGDRLYEYEERQSPSWPATASELAVAADLPGALGTRWTTDARVLNPGPGWAKMWLRPDEPGGLAEWARLRIPPGAQARLDDLAGRWLGRPGWKGPVELRTLAEHPPVVTSRIATTGDDGSYGQGVHSHLVTRGRGRVQLPMVREDAGFRSNLGLVNDGLIGVDTSASFELVLRAADGRELGATFLELGPGEFRQLDRVASRLTVEPVAGGVLEVRADDPDQVIGAYLSVVDNATGDPAFVTPMQAHRIDPVVLGAVAHLDGLEGSRWTTDLQLVDLGGGGARVRLTPLPAADWQGSTEPVTLEVPAGGALTVADAAGSLYAATGAAALLMEVLEGSADLASRTFSSGRTGTYGQTVMPISAFAEHPLPQDLWLAGLEESDDARTNLGLVNPGDSPLTVVVELRGELGELVGSFPRTIAPRSLEILPRVARLVTAQPFRGSIRLRRLEADAPWTAWASVVAAGSHDPVFVPASR